MEAAEPTVRRERKKARTRRNVFESAFALFRTRGFEAVTVEEICREADVARGTFFQHFPTKAALLAEWDRQLARELALHLEARRSSALGEYRALAQWLAEHWLRQPDLMAALLAEQLRAGAQGGSALLGALEAVARRGQQRGALRRNVSPRLAAWLLLSGSAALSAGALGEPASGRDPAPDELLLALLSGLREPKPRVAWRPPAEGPS